MSEPQKNLYDLIIIGSGPAGASAAIYAGRAKLRTLVIDAGESGGQIRITNEVVNYPGILSVSGEQLGETLRRQTANFGAETCGAKVTGVDFAGDIKEVRTAAGDFAAPAVLIATGAVPRRLGFEGEDTFSGHGVGYCATCDGEFFTGMDIFVIGGGFAAAEEAMFLTRYAKTVHLIVREDWFTCSRTIGEKVLATPGIETHFNTELQRLTGDSVPRAADFLNNKAREAWHYQPAGGNATFGVFVFVGYAPQSEVFKGQVPLDAAGYIPTDADMMTEVPGIFAAGDIRPKRLRQLVTAVADGAQAATAAELYVTEVKSRLGLVIAPPAIAAPAETTSPAPAPKTDAAPADGSGMFDAELAAQLKPVLEKFEQPVQLALILPPGNGFAEEMGHFAADFAALAPEKISVRRLLPGEDPTLEKTLPPGLLPVMVVCRADGTDTGIRYHAVPGGHEFDSFVLALYNAAGPGQALEAEVLQRIQKLPGPITVQVGISLSCTMCPAVVQGMQQISIHNPGVRTEVIDIAHFPEFKSRHNIMSVPAIVVGGKLDFGKKSLEQLLTLMEAQA